MTLVGSYPEEVIARIADADIVVKKVYLTADTLAQAPRLLFIDVAATGTDNVDHAAYAAHGIVVIKVRNFVVHTVPEHTYALTFPLQRCVCAYRDAVRAGCWHDAGQFCFSTTRSVITQAQSWA